jgi:GH35 family endo-1,4-beta-xylanase/acetyl esterase/lipase
MAIRNTVKRNTGGRRVFCILLYLAVPLWGLSQDTISGRLPPVLNMADGTPVKTIEQWNTRRRPEILGIFTRQMFGRSPGRPADMTFRVVDNDPVALGGIATRRQIRVLFNGRADGPFMDILLYLPNQVKRPVPLFVGYNFAGNQSINDDTAIPVSTGWMGARTKGVAGNRATEATRGIASGAWPVAMILKRGYGLATMYAGDVAPDYDNGFKEGAPALYPELQTGGDNFSTMAAWAWGLSRAMDYFETDKAIDSKEVIVYGTSRMGKAAVWAGATDQRFAMVISNESGAGGAKLFHHLGGEDIGRLCRVFPYWFCRNFRQYAGKDTALPFDQHMELALIAPRPLYVASAQGSPLTDSYGEFLSAKYADTVYRLFHTAGLPVKEMPPADQAVSGQIGYHNRQGKHDILPYDWEQFLTFADRHFNNRPDTIRTLPDEVIHLWPGDVPGETGAKHPAKPAPAARNGITLITDVTDPLITVYKPAPQLSLGIGMVICPGGGNKYLSAVTEGEDVAKWFTDRGFTAFVLQYRVPDQRAGALQDVLRALRVIRGHAGNWNLDIHKLGVMGFSAGGNLAARASTEYNRETYIPVDKADSFSCRPDFAVLVYPGGLALGPEHKLIPELTVDRNTSPTFLFVANDDPIGIPLSYAYALHDAKVPMELHVYPSGGHGFGLHRGNGMPWEWPGLAEKWIKEIIAGSPFPVQHPSLKDAFRNDFFMGAAMGYDEINGEHPGDTSLIKEQFNAVSSAVLEWNDINPRPGVYHFETADRYVAFGERNQLFIMAHGLIWHHLAPEWIFEDKEGRPATRDTLLQRMKRYIFTVAGRYKGRINGWIVANEALENNGGLRKTKWLEIIGKDYLQKAFEYAHEADPDAKLYYNDYDLWMPAKRAALVALVRDLRSKGVTLDGIGIQGHWSLDYPSLDSVAGAIADFSKLGVPVMITELDVSVLPRPGRHTGAEISDSYGQSRALDPYPGGLPDSMQHRLAERYGEIFALFHRYRGDIRGVTFWGANDGQSWRNDWPIKGRTDYPMLFDRSDRPKPAFYAVIKQPAVRDTFYLDPVNASSRGDGKSPSNPARILPGSVWGRPGITILYKRGITVRGEFSVFPGTPEAPVIVGAYGKGPQPVFMKSIDLDTAKYWVRESGNIWKCKRDLKATPCANIVYDGGRYCGAMRWSKEDLKKQGDWYMIDTVGGKFRFRDALYIYSRGNPASVCRSIEYVPSGNFHTFRDGDSCIIVQDIHIKNAGTHGFWFNGGHDIAIRRCDISYIGGAVFTPRIGKNGMWVRYGNAIEIWKKGRDLTIEQCRIYENYDAGFVAQGSCGAGCIDSIVVRSNLFWNNGFDNFDNSWGKSISRVYFEHNTCIDAGDGWAYQTEGRPRLSEFLPDTVGWHIFLDSFALDKSSIWIRNNIFYNARDNELLKVNKLPADGWPQVHLDYNCYYQENPKAVLVQVVNAVYGRDNFAQYQSGTGKDVHSIVANPLFVDPGRRDYRLRPHSPCIHAGIVTGRKVDFTGRPVPAGELPDMGAIEYVIN